MCPTVSALCMSPGHLNSGLPGFSGNHFALWTSPPPPAHLLFLTILTGFANYGSFLFLSLFWVCWLFLLCICFLFHRYQLWVYCFFSFFSLLRHSLPLYSRNIWNLLSPRLVFNMWIFPVSASKVLGLKLHPMLMLLYLHILDRMSFFLSTFPISVTK